MIVCPCCQGKGEIEETIPNMLTTNQRRIYEMLLKQPLGGPAIAERMYGNRTLPDRKDATGDILTSVHVQIHQMNKRLAAVGKQVKADKKGWHARYFIQDVV